MPLVADTDGDSINDGDEIALGLNPLSADSNNDGCPDNEEVSAQSLSNDDLKAFNEGNAYTLNIDVNAAGYAKNSAAIDESGFSYITSTNEAVLGKVVAVSYAENQMVDGAALKFTIPEDTLNSARNYPDSVELAGLNRYAVFHYSEEYNIMYPVAVTYDAASRTLTVNSDELGDYFVVDLDKWFFDMGITPDQQTEETFSIADFSLEESEETCYTQEEEPVAETTAETSEETTAAETEQVIEVSGATTWAQKIKPVDVVFIVDCTDNLQSNFANVKANIISAGEEIFSMCDNARICVIAFWASATPSCGTSTWSTSFVQLKTRVNSLTQRTDIANSLHGAALNKASGLSYRSDATRFGFMIFDEYSQWSSDMTGEMITAGVQKIINAGINFSILYTPLRTTLGDKFTNLISATDGYDGTNQGYFYTNIAQHICNDTAKIPVVEPEDPTIEKNCVDISGTVMLSDFSGRVPVEIDEVTNSFGSKIRKGSNIDRDSDGLYDFKEVDWNKLYQPSANVYECWTYGNINSATTLRVLHISSFSRIKVLPILSNPWEKDSDGDGYFDKYDDIPLKNQ